MRKFFLLGSLLVLFTGCANPQFHWGSYEDSLYLTYQNPGEEGETEALSMLDRTIIEAKESQVPMAPGIYAEYGYLLFKQGKHSKAIAALKKEAELFPESQHLMQTMISRIETKTGPLKEKKSQ